VVPGNTRLTIISYDHYDLLEMKKTPTGISPIIAIDRRASKPLHRQVYDAFRTAIVERSVRAGQRVPSTRILALELGISRIPILTAYAQLVGEGYFESRIGAGTVVSRSLPDQVTFPETRGTQPAKVQVGSRRLSKRCANFSPVDNVPWRRGWGAFGVSQVAFGHFPFQVWNALVTRHCRSAHAKSLDYGDPMGSKDLREAIAAYLRTARGVRCEAQQIMVVSGSQQALDISARVFFDPGSRVWMEEPGYRFAREVLAINGCQIVPVPVDYSGMDVAVGIQRCRTARAALVTPSHQYPLGVTMSASRRMQLLDWAQNSQSWIIEDDYDSEYRYESRPIASLQGLDANSRVVYIGTFSKVLFPSLRLGYLVVPPDLIGRFRAVRLAMDIGPSHFFQAVLADFIREGHFSRHIRRMRLLYSERRKVLIDCIREELGFGADVTGGEAGMHLSVTLKGIRDVEVAERASHENLWLVPLSTSYIGKPSRHGFILGFGSTEVKDIPDAVRKLRTLLTSK
jgi:GntR family transcriptional regulator / MocR family aminotransferase